MTRRRARLAARLASFAVASWVAAPVGAGALSGPVLDTGVRAALVDLVQLPASAGSGPRARINGLHEAPDGSGRLFANDLRGKLYAIDAAGVHTYLDLAALRPALKTSPGLATGFVSLAFHPAFATSGRFYTVHTEFAGGVPTTHGPALPAPIAHHSVLTEWTAASPAANAFSGGSRELLRVAAPHHFHNLGELAFDPTAGPGNANYGLLYIGNGDYGSVERGQPEQLQRLDTVFGALLRIDPLGGSGAPYSYGIPASNPFASDADPSTLGEIYAYGLRNAHRLSWSTTGFGGPFVSDVGEDHLEEINLPAAGANYGWPVREGNRALDPDTDPGTVFPLPPNDATFGFRYPVAQYDHEEGSAIAGGFVYEVDAASRLHGKFVFGDIVNGRIFYADAGAMYAADDADPATTASVYELTLLRAGVETTLLDVVRTATARPGLTRVDLRFATDLAGNLYVTTKQDGFVRRLIPETTASIPALPGLTGALLGLALVAGGLAHSRFGSRAWPRRGSGS